MFSRRLATVLLFALCLLPAGVAQAGFAPVGETIFEAEQTSSPGIAIDAAGDSIVVWSQEKTLGDPEEAKLRRVGVDGALGPAVDLAPGEIASVPAIGITAGGRAFVAWLSRTEESGPASVKGRWVEENGAMGPVLTLVVGKAGQVTAGEIDVAIDPAGVATVTWINFEGNRIGLRRVQPDGTLGALLSDVSGAAALTPATVALPNGSTVVVWRGAGVQMTVVDAALGVGLPLKLSATGSGVNPDVAADSAGNALVVWRADLGLEYGAYGQRLGPQGQLVGGELAIDPLGTDFVNKVSVAADSGDDFAVVWDRQTPSNSKVVLARRVSAGGGLAGAANPINETAEKVSPGAVPVLFDVGIGAVAWKGGAESAVKVLGRQIDASGTPTAPGQEIFAKPSVNTVSAASAPAIGAAAFLVHYPISGSAQGGFVRRFLAPPTCSPASADVRQGRPTAVKLVCAGAALGPVRIVKGPRHGSLGSLDQSGPSVVYRPKPGFRGTDSFTFDAANEGGTSAVAKVTIEVRADTVKPRVKTLKLIRKGAVGKQSFRFRLAFSEPATAKLTIKRVVRVRGKGKLVKVGIVRSRKAAPRATLKVRGALARRLNAGGRFRAVAVAADRAGNRSALKLRAFRVG